MLIVINALKSIVRSKGRNILICLLALTVAAASCVALAIRAAAKDAEEVAKTNLSVTGSIIIDREKMHQQMQQGSGMFQIDNISVPLEELQTYAASVYVGGFHYNARLGLNKSGDIVPYELSSSSDGSGDNGEANGSFGGDMPRGGGSFAIAGGGMGDFQLTGYSSEDAMTDFKNGTAKLNSDDGSRLFDFESDTPECLVSSDLVMMNYKKDEDGNLIKDDGGNPVPLFTVGDTITLSNPGQEEETYTFTVVGVYTLADSSDENAGPMPFAGMNPANNIIVSYPALAAVAAHSEEVAGTTTDMRGNEMTTAFSVNPTGTFLFTEKDGKSALDNYEAFKAAVHGMGLSEDFTVTSADAENYEESLIPMRDLSHFAMIMLLVILAVGGVMLVIINLFNIRERKYEVGVLTAIGIKKGKVAMQFVAELLTVTMIGILIGAAAGAFASVPVADKLLENQITSQKAKADAEDVNYGRAPGGGTGGPVSIQGAPVGGRTIGGGPVSFSSLGRGADVSYADKINAAVNVPVVLQLIAIGCLLTLLSSLAAIVFIMRYEPLKILANRS